MSIKGLIFDFDGLILDTETPRFQAWQEVFAFHGHDFSLDNYSKTIGSNNSAFDPLLEMRKFISDPKEIQKLLAFQQNRELELLENQSTLPGVEKLINSAKNNQLRLAIASSSDRAWVINNLERLKIIHNFQYIWTEDEVEQVKPFPELYRKAMQSLGFTASEVAAFEDSPNGIRAAQAANIFTICVPNAITRLLDVSHADLIIDSLLDFDLNIFMSEFSTRSK